MQQGICKLCLKDKMLCDSHYIPSAIYRRARKQSGGNPIVMTPNLIISTQDQVHDYVFCSDCEDRINLGGERYLMCLVANGNEFPLRDLIRICTPQKSGPFLRFSGRQARVDTAKLAYFAISLLWRGAIHSWRTLEGQTMKLEVRSDMEEMRRYLLSEQPMPSDIVIFTMVCLDKLSQVQSTAPFLMAGYEHEDRYEMLLNGIAFQVGLGRAQAEIDYYCCIHSRERAIFAGDRYRASLDSSLFFHESARIDKNVRRS